MTNSLEIYGVRINLAPIQLFIVVALLFSIVGCIAGANSYAGVKGLIIALIGLVLLGVLCAVLLASATYIRV